MLTGTPARERRLQRLLPSLLLSFFGLIPAADAAQPGPLRCGSVGPYGPDIERPGQMDPLLARQWGLRQIDAPEAWRLRATGRNVTIALIDSGVDLTHPDLDDNIVGGIDLMPWVGVCRGPQDEFGHGTFTAGILAAEAQNGIGVRGVAYEADVLPIRSTADAFPFYPVTDVVDPNGSEAERLIAAIDHAVATGAEVILMQIGLSPIDDPSLERAVAKAIERAWNAGAVLVAPAVNASAPSCFYPASDEHVLCAAATDHEGRPASYSSLPVSHRSLNAVRAPGGSSDSKATHLRGFLGVPDTFCQDRDVWSTVLPVDATWGCDGAAYDSAAGTSWAAPHVAGAAALLAGRGATNEEIVRCITSTASNPVTGLRGTYDPVYGYGILDADDALLACRK